MRERRKKDQNQKSYRWLIQSMLPVFIAFNCLGRQNACVTNNSSLKLVHVLDKACRKKLVPNYELLPNHSLT